LLLFVFVWSPVLSVCAQSTKTPPSTEEEEKRQQELRRKTLDLVDEIVASVSTLKLPENRTYILTSAANLLWPHDEKRARNAFSEAINSLNSIKLPKPSSGQQASSNAYFEVFGLRRQILRAVAERDPQFALELLQSSRQIPPELTNTDWFIATERDLEQEIAASAAERDPKKSLQVARESLAKGFSVQLVNLLSLVNDKDKELGTKFAIEIIDKLRTAEMSTDRVAPMVAAQLLWSSRRDSQNVSILSGGNSTPRGMTQPLELPKEERRTLVDLLSSAALTVSASPVLLSLANGIQGEVEEFFPERVALLKRKSAEFNPRLAEMVKAQEQRNDLVRRGQAEDLLREALKVPEQDRFWLEREAILAAVFSKKTESFRDFINNQVDDDSRRKRILDSLDTQEIEFASHLGDAETLRKLLPKIRLKEQRARALAETAVILEAKGDHDTALDLLNQAESLIKIDLYSETKSEALLALMLAYALVEPSRAFVITERTIDRANDDISKAVLVDKFIKTGMIKKGEIIMSQSGVMPLDYMILKYGKGVVALARADFGRTKAAADRFERNELRIFARLLIAQGLLGEKPNAIILRAY